MITRYLNPEVDGYLDLYMTTGSVVKTDGGMYSYNSRGGYKMLLETFREDSHKDLTAEQRAGSSVRDWQLRYSAAKIPVQYGNEMVLTYEAPGEAEEKPVKTKQHKQ